MKRFLAFGGMVCIFFSLFSQVLAQNTSENYFVVTAYYSPLPDQEHYLTGNYEDEVILNGQWIAGASGQKVHSGMLAAPGKYAFWTKIYLEWLWVWVVHDRGGAIVPAGERGYNYDRIDVWMGYGDEGLKRALWWGKRTISGYIVDQNSMVNIHIDSLSAPNWATEWLKKNTPAKQTVIPNIFQVNLWKGNDSYYVQELQNILAELWYEISASGIYDSQTISAIFLFQKDQNILQNESDIWAGYYGPKTRETLQKVYTVYQQQIQKIAENEAKALVKAQDAIELIGNPEYWDIHSWVRELQVSLAKLWFFTEKDTAIFGDKTKKALIEYQLKGNIIESEAQSDAGIFWEKTKQALLQDLKNYYLDNLMAIKAGENNELI